MYKFLRNNTEALYDPENDVVQEVPWNFAKFILDGVTGQVVSYYNPRISPLSLRKEIEGIIQRNTEKYGSFIPKIKYKTKEEIEQAIKDNKNIVSSCGGEACKKPAEESKSNNRI